LVFLLLLHLLLIVHIGLIGHEEAWELIFKRAKRLQRLTNDILDVSRIETGQLSYRFEVYLHGTFSYIMKTNRKLKERAPESLIINWLKFWFWIQMNLYLDLDGIVISLNQFLQKRSELEKKMQEALMDIWSPFLYGNENLLTVHVSACRGLLSIFPLNSSMICGRTFS
jgi:signal transduction histidine kinase